MVPDYAKESRRRERNLGGMASGIDVRIDNVGGRAERFLGLRLGWACGNYRGLVAIIVGLLFYPIGRIVDVLSKPKVAAQPAN